MREYRLQAGTIQGKRFETPETLSFAWTSLVVGVLRGSKEYSTVLGDCREYFVARDFVSRSQQTAKFQDVQRFTGNGSTLLGLWSLAWISLVMGVLGDSKEYSTVLRDCRGRGFSSDQLQRLRSDPVCGEISVEAFRVLAASVGVAIFIYTASRVFRPDQTLAANVTLFAA